MLLSIRRSDFVSPARMTSYSSKRTPVDLADGICKYLARFITGNRSVTALMVDFCPCTCFGRASKRNNRANNANIKKGAEVSELQPSFPEKYQIFSFDEVTEATSGFHPDNKVGEGGFGHVYKGKLADGREVAVKKLSSGSRQGKREFINEVNLITSVQHRNLIKLFGCCVEGSERLLVYEYLPNKSLDKLLFDHSEGGSKLDWRTRREIILGTARGLMYLHEDSRIRMVHRDIKASNILLDENFNPKIADFGLAKLFSSEQTHVSTRVAGTLGYLAPEYAMNGKLTEKTDIFSFGIVALEVVSGRRNTDIRLPPEKHRLLELGWRLYKDQRPLEMVDPRLNDITFFAEEVIRVVHIALLCTQAEADLRPTMSKVILLLSGQSQIQERPTRPAFVHMTRNRGGPSKLSHATSSSSSSHSGSPSSVLTETTKSATTTLSEISEINPR